MQSLLATHSTRRQVTFMYQCTTKINQSSTWVGGEGDAGVEGVGGYEKCGGGGEGGFAFCISYALETIGY